MILQEPYTGRTMRELVSSLRPNVMAQDCMLHYLCRVDS